MISNIIITDNENVSSSVLATVADDWNGSKNLISLLKECMSLNANIDVYLPADIFFYINSPVIKFLIRNNLDFKYDENTYKIYYSFTPVYLEKLLIVNPYTNAKFGGYMFLYKHQDIGLKYNNKVIYANIDVANISNYVNNETILKYDTWLVNTIPSLARGDFEYKAKLVSHIGEQSIIDLLHNNVLRMEGKRYYLNIKVRKKCPLTNNN